jgi:uncharacterized protein (UPF0128 family)
MIVMNNQDDVVKMDSPDFRKMPMQHGETLAQYRQRVRTEIGYEVPTFMLDRMYRQNRLSNILNSARSVSDIKKFIQNMIVDLNV